MSLNSLALGNDVFLTGGAFAVNGGNLNFFCGSCAGSAGTGADCVGTDEGTGSGVGVDDEYAGGAFCGGSGTGDGE